MAKYLKEIMGAKEEEKEDEDEDNIFNQARIEDIEQANEEAYLLS